MTMLGPTPERLRRAQSFDLPGVDQKRRVHSFRLVDPIETMTRDGRLNDEQAHAFRRFEKDYTDAQKSSALLSRYGERASGGGTPLSQLANDLLCPEERRADAFRKAHEAAIAVGEPRSVEALIMIVTSASTLADVGRQVLRVKNRGQAVAAAAVTLQIATYKLAEHYGLIIAPHARASPS